MVDVIGFDVEFSAEQARLQGILTEVGNDSQRGMMIRFAILENLKSAVQRFLDRYDEEMKALEQQIVDSLISDGQQNVKSSDTGRTFFRRQETYYNVPAEKKDELIAVFDQVDSSGQPLYPQFAGMLKRDYNTNRFKSVCRETIEQDGELPAPIAALVKVSTGVKLGVRK